MTTLKDSNSSTPKRKPGNKTKYTPELAEKILARLAAGETLTSICKKVGIAPATVYRWTVANDEFAREFARARDFGDQVLEDEAIDIADEHEDREETIDTVNANGASQTVIRKDAVHHRRLRAEIRLKIVARRKGAKIQLQTDAPAGEGLAAVYEKIKEVSKGKT